MKKFTVLYNSIKEPPPKEQSSVLSALQGTILDQIPGSISVLGNKEQIRQALNPFPDWQLHPQQDLQANSSVIKSSYSKTKPKLSLVYGIIADPTLLLIESSHTVHFNDNTQVIGFEVETAAANEFIPIQPYDIDENHLDSLFRNHLKKMIAEAEEVVGEQITASQLNMWEKRLRIRKPQLMVGIRQV